MDRAAVGRQRWFRLLTSKSVFWPALIGLGVLLLASGTVETIIGVAGLGISAASAFWKLTRGSHRLTQQAQYDLQERNSRAHLAYLRQLQRRLRGDQDQRTGQCLRQLRDLYKRMQRVERDHDAPDLPPSQEIKEQARHLYQTCLTALERSFKLWAAAQDMTTSEKQDQLMASREHVLLEVDRSIQQLGKTLDQLQSATLVGELPQDDLIRMRQQLDQGLEVARNVQQRMDDMERELRIHDES